ncbi:MAG: right-handed parallel beta-helix repeat-containing protein [Oscillospiraceae bacterium]
MTATTGKALRFLLAAFAAALVFMLYGCINASAADGANAWGGQLPDYNSGIEIDVVEKYKADNTGANDSASAIQKALNIGRDQASDTNKVVVKVPAGTYSISKGLRIYSNTQLILDPNATIIKKFSNGCMLSNKNADDTVGGYSGTHNILIEGGTFDGNTSQYGSVYAFSNIRIAHANNVIFRNVTVLNNKNGHHMEIGGVSGLTIEGCYFSGYSGSLLKEAIQLDVMHSEELFTGFSPFDDTTCDNVIIRNCTFRNIPRAIGSHSAVVGKYYTNVSITGNTFDNVSNICMVLYNYKHCSITNNTITNSGAGITFNYMSDENFRHYFSPLAGFANAKANIDGNADLVIENNTITTSQTTLQFDPYAIKIYGVTVSADTADYPAYNYTISNVRIASNTINSAACAISMLNVYDSTVKDNSISINKEAGSVEKDLVSASYCFGISFKDNSVSDSLKCGVRASNVSDFNITGNKITGCSNASVVVSAASESTVSKNTFDSNELGALKISEGSSDITCTGNVVKGFGDYGIQVIESGSGTDIKIKSNDFSGGSVGILCAKNGKAYLTGNSFEAVTDKVSAVSEGLVTLAKAKNFTAEEVTEDRIKLTWNAVSEADGIEVYRRKAGFEEFDLIASVDSGSIFQDEKLFSGTNYFYKIIPYIDVDGVLWQNTESDEINARTKVNIESAYVGCITEAGFTSRPVTPNFYVTANSTQLVPGRDYSFEYVNNINVGTASIIISGKGNYIGTLSYTFEINLAADPVMNTLTRRTPELSAFSVQPNRTYRVECSQRSEMSLANSDERISLPERTLNSLRLQSGVSFSTSAAVWTDGGYVNI